MSFLGMGRSQPSSEQKIAAVEGEMRMMADTYNRYAGAPPPFSPSSPLRIPSPAGTVPPPPGALADARRARSLQKMCQKKCVPTDYREGELNKGESVCLDRCTGKFLDASIKVSEIMQQQGQAVGGAPQQGAAAGGGLF